LSPRAAPLAGRVGTGTSAGHPTRRRASLDRGAGGALARADGAALRPAALHVPRLEPARQSTGALPASAGGGARGARRALPGPLAGDAGGCAGHLEGWRGVGTAGPAVP